MTDFSKQDYSGAQPTDNLNDLNRPTKPDNNLVLSIVATVVSLITCCGFVSCIGVILGIIAIVFSTQVDSKYFAGDFAGAESASKNARLLSFIAIGTIVLSIVWFIISIITAGGFSAIMEQYQNALEQYR